MKLLYLVESGESKFLVFDEMPDKISTKYGDDTIIGRIGGIFYDFLAKRNERREAFGGRKFDIVLDNGEIEKCEGQWWDAVTDRAREELEKEGNPFSKMVLIGVSSVDRLLDCYVYYGLWASESKIEEMIADYKGRIIHLYENPYWVSPIPSTGCSKVRSPDSFTKQNVFDFTYPTNIFFLG